MIVEYIRYRVPEARGEELEDAYRHAAASLEASPHCQRYELSRCIDEPGVSVVRIEWDSAEGHMSRFRSSPEFRAFFEAVRPFADEIEEMRHYEVKLAG